MYEATCETCGDNYEINAYVMAGQLASGELRKANRRGRFGYSVDWYVGICQGCRKLIPPEPSAPWTVESEARRYQKLIAEQHKLHPTWKLRSLVRAAGKVFHDPHLEPNADFRAYLLDREVWCEKPSPFDKAA